MHGFVSYILEEVIATVLSGIDLKFQLLLKLM